MCRCSEKTADCNAEVAQLVEHDLAKVGVAGSSPVFRSRGYKASCHLAIRRFSLQSGLRGLRATGFLLHNPRCGAFPQGKYCGALVCPDGGIGRRVGLKHQWGKTRTGSIPVPGTALPPLYNSWICVFPMFGWVSTMLCFACKMLFLCRIGIEE